MSKARERRKQPTVSEGLLWSILRARQLCGLKFRREHPIGAFIADFACVDKKLIVEVDGGYHDRIQEQDLVRQHYLQNLGWDVIRFTDKDVENDCDAVGLAITRHLGLEHVFQKRLGGKSGNRSSPISVGNRCHKQPQQTGPSPLVPRDPPEGG